ncbi:MAG: DUF1223 domain-containing protein [Pseudomonadota bacterium]
MAVCRAFRPLLAAAGLVALLLPASDARANVAVLELFTSQGCSSCPPADALMGTLADRPEVIALSLPIDYWDYLGWKDSFADPAHTARQRGYAASRGDRMVFTPQIIVNGETSVVGNKQADVEAAIAEAASSGVSVDLASADDMLTITLSTASLPTAESGAKVRILLLGYSDTEEVQIGRGENAGRAVTYHNVVRKIVDLGTWDGDGKTLTVSTDRMGTVAKGITGCAVLVQEVGADGPGRILGAAQVSEL